MNEVFEPCQKKMSEEYRCGDKVFNKNGMHYYILYCEKCNLKFNRIRVENMKGGNVQ